MSRVPEIDITALVTAATDGAGGHTGAWNDPAVLATAAAIDAACREMGFFTVVGHGVDPALVAALHDAARRFFALPDEVKAQIAMPRGGRAWRGWFPLGGELTAGVADQKEGLYLGRELAPEDPRVVAGIALHGPNLFPAEPPELGPLVLGYLDELTRVGQAVLAGMAIGLGLDPAWFRRELTTDPVVLFRIFHYPPTATERVLGSGKPGDDGRATDTATGTDREAVDQGDDLGGWGVAEHTDYGLLTLLGQDGTPGLEVRTPDGWTSVDARPDRFVANIGDMLERLTGGRYRSTPHRVRNTSGIDRLSFPFFLDPSWDAVVDRLPIVDRPSDDDGAARWDRTSVHGDGAAGTYGDYLLAKVAKVFPALAADA